MAWFYRSRFTTLAALAVLTITIQAKADTYNRFWRGIKRADMDWTQFQAGLNQVFILATVQTGAGKGMTAYQPVLLEGSHGLPDEIALVSYADKPAYDALYATDAGKAYQNLHWQYFDKASSQSLVPQAFAGSIETDQAYDFHPQYADWMPNTTTVLAYFRGSDESPAEFLKRAQSSLADAFAADGENGILDRAVLISEQYWIEYVSSSATAASTLRADLIAPVLTEAPSTAQIVLGQGVNLQF